MRVSRPTGKFYNEVNKSYGEDARCEPFVDFLPGLRHDVGFRCDLNWVRGQTRALAKPQ